MNKADFFFGDDSVTLFVLVTAMLVYRTVDLFSTRAKLDQLALNVHWWQDLKITTATLRGALRQCKSNARTVLPKLKLLMWLRQEFVAGLMLLYLGVLAMVGYSFLLSEAVRTGNKVTMLVAIATGIVSLISSAANLLIEKVKNYV